jgi:parallel beta-helix repeat protein
MHRLIYVSALLAVFAFGCDDDGSGGSADGSGGSADGSGGSAGGAGGSADGAGGEGAGGMAAGGGGAIEPPEGCDAWLTPADDQATIQTALIEAESGQTICFSAGRFDFETELSLSIDGVVLQGAGQGADESVDTILDFGRLEVGANGLRITGDDVTVTELRVLDAPGDGIRADDVMNIRFINVTVWWTADESTENGAYGLYPVGCDGVLIDGVVAKGASDAGVYVGQSRNIIVRNTEAFGNVAGIEIENSTDAEVVDNYAHDNTGGIIIFNLPGLSQYGDKVKAHRNRVINNNAENFAEPGAIVQVIPPGTGFAILAHENVEIHDNEITGHDSSGIIMISYLELIFGPPDDDGFDIFPRDVWIHDNTFADNGATPRGALRDLGIDAPAPDILWDGCIPEGGEQGLCFSDNAGDPTFRNVDLCMQAGMESEDITPLTCMGTAQPSIEL